MSGETTLLEDLHQRIAAGLSRIGLVMRHHAQSAAASHGMSPLQAQALGVLRGRLGGLRVGGLAQELAVTDATASDALSSLVAKSLVVKKSDPEEHRAVRAVLTREGRRVAEEIAVWPDFLRPAVDDLPATDTAALLRVLVGIIRNLEQRGEIPVSRMCVSCQFFAPNRHPGRVKEHHCEFIDAPIGGTDIRIDCTDFEAADEGSRDRLWNAFVGAAD